MTELAINELSFDEIDAVDGGIAFLLLVPAILEGVAYGVGIWGGTYPTKGHDLLKQRSPS